MTILGAVLAGGKSSRFGSDKALALYRGLPLIDHAMRTLTTICDTALICGRAYSGYQWVPDRPAVGLGPLGGLCAALDYARRYGFDRVVSIGCDTPDISHGVLSSLVTDQGSAFAEDLPVIGCWDAELAPLLDEFIANDPIRSMRGWARVAGARPVASGPTPNINTLADLAALTRD